ncbi:hypothetical protein MVEN_01996500 [Mycena venus]|uniref:Uncharacterized protein n=1 Tax=Mycena venus TaxID=2733690 RepID=A0A8H7CKC8_9AGAR|nr:hypothetical protein MVEN_01996500 [Mycena venus]
MSNANQQLVSARTAIASVTKGAAVNEDSWMWCSTNWGDLLQPAPLSIALLGSILIIASSTQDFSLDSKAPAGCPPFEWKYALRPDSFKTCLQQMVNDGFNAFGTAHRNMESIRNTAEQMPGQIKTLVDLVNKGSCEDIEDHFQNSLNGLLSLSQTCRDRAQECDRAFKGITGLAQEMVLACTYTAGTTEQALAQNKVQLEVLELQKTSEEAMVKEAQANSTMMKKSYLKAEEAFQKACDDVPKGWDLVGMQVVESLTGESLPSLVVSAGNALISQATLKSQAASAGINAFSGLTGSKDSKPATPAPTPVAPTTSPTGVSTQPNSAALADPGTPLVLPVLAQANAIKMLICGGPNGKPDWDKIRGTKSGAAYVQATLNSQKSQCDTSKPVSKQLETLICDALAIVTAIMQTAGTVAAANDTALADKVTPTDQCIAKLEALNATANLILQQPGINATGLATPATPPAQAATGAAQLAVQNAKMKVDQTRSQLEATRDSFEKASDRLVKQQQEITKTIGDLTKLQLTNTNLQCMLPVLTKAVGAFSTLRAQFSQLCQFFDSVVSLLVDVMGPSVDRWVETLTSAAARGAQQPSCAGITVSAFTRDLIYRQMMTPLKVSMLATRIAGVYCEVSNDYIMPAQRGVGNMLQFADSPSSQQALIQRLTTAQAELSRSSTLASTKISAKVAADQKTFSTSINNRLNTIVQAVSSVPAICAPTVPANLKAIANAHVADTAATAMLQADVNPMFDADDAM